MEFFDWSIGYVYLGSYVNIVLMCSECDVMQSHRVPVASLVYISPWINRAGLPLMCSVCGQGSTHNVIKPAIALDMGITQEQLQDTTVINIIEECPLREGFCPCKH